MVAPQVTHVYTVGDCPDLLGTRDPNTAGMPAVDGCWFATSKCKWNMSHGLLTVVHRFRCIWFQILDCTCNSLDLCMIF